MEPHAERLRPCAAELGRRPKRLALVAVSSQCDPTAEFMRQLFAWCQPVLSTGTTPWGDLGLQMERLHCPSGHLDTRCEKAEPVDIDRGGVGKEMYVGGRMQKGWSVVMIKFSHPELLVPSTPKVNHLF